MNTYKRLTEKDKESYGRDGYVITRGFYSSKEADLLLRSYLNDQVLQEHTYGTLYFYGAIF